MLIFAECGILVSMMDPHSISTNDISAIVGIFSEEAARQALVGEAAGVFGVYGINRSLKVLIGCLIELE